MQEPVFPRGGHILSKSSIAKPSGSYETKNEHKTSKKKQKKKDPNVQEDDADVPIIVPLGLQTLNEGWIVLGTVIDVMDYTLKLSLPGSISAKVDFTNISKIYSDLLQGLAKSEDEDEEQDVPLLPALFCVGQSWPCAVIEVTKDPVRPRFSLSLDPSLVNKGLFFDNLLPNMPLVGAVKSSEEHGYVIELGISKAVGFLPYKDLRAQPLTIGQLVHCKVQEITGRSVKLAYLPSFPSSSPLKEIPHLDALRPGMTLEFVITMVEEVGLGGKLGSYTVCVHRHHLANHPWDTSKSYSVGQKALGTVLYVHDITRQVHMKLVDKFQNATHRRLLQLSQGQDIKDAEVKLVTKNGLYLSLPTDVRAFAPKRNLLDKNSEVDIKQLFPCKSKQNCRIVSLDLVDNQVTVTLRKSDLSKTFINYKDLKVGDTYQGVVDRLTPKGAVIQLDSHLNGFIRFPFLSDTILRNPEKLYPPGTKLNCKVIQVKPGTGLPLLVLTAKKSFLKSKLPIPSLLSDLQPGQKILGVVVQICSQGLLVATYNGIQGWVQPKYASTQGQPLEEVFHIGQTVTAKVLKCDSETGKLYLTLNITDNIAGPSVGETASNCRVVNRSDAGLQVEVTPGVIASLPLMHLSDHPELCQPLLDSIVDTVPGTLRCFSCKRVKFTEKYIFTRKSILLNAHSLKTTFESLSLGQLVPGVVRNITGHGVFIDLGNNYTALARHKDEGALSTKERDLLAVGYSVEALVKGLNEEEQTAQLSLKLTDVWNSSRVSASVDYLASFLEDWLFLTRLRPGTIVPVEVEKVSPAGVHVSFPSHPELEGFANGTSGVNTEPGLKAKAVVLVDNGNTVEVSLSPSLVKQISKQGQKPEKCHEVKTGQVIRCQALAIHSKFVLAALAGHAVGKLVYIPTRKHIMDHVGRQDLFTLGENYHVIIKSIEKDFMIGVLKQHDKEFLRKMKIEANASRKEKRKISESNEPNDDALKKGKSPKKKKILSTIEDSSDLQKSNPITKSPNIECSPRMLPESSDVEEKAEEMEEDEPSFSDEIFQVPIDEDELGSNDEDKTTASKNEQGDFDLFTSEGSSLDSKEQEVVKMLRAAPNKSLLWLQYMACALEKQDTERVRQIAKQALDTISQTEHDERLNVWLGLINFELNHGTEDQLEKTIQNGLQNCEPSKFYSKLVRVYETAGQLERAQETLSTFLRKCRTQKSAWIQAAVFYMKHTDFAKARAIKERCLNNLSKKEYVEVVCKLGQLEFQYGDPEQGKTVFDTLVTSLPSRADLVSVYLDMLLKYNHIESARSLLHKLDVLKLPDKKKEALKKKLENI